MRYLWMLLIILAVASPAFGQVGDESALARIGAEIIDNLGTFYPVMATSKGMHQYDYRLPDYSKNSIKNEISRLKKFQSRLLQIKPEQLSLSDRIDLKLLKSNVEIALQNLDKIKWYQKNPYMYVDEIINGVYLILVSQYAPFEARAQGIIARMKEVPDFLAQARINIKKPAPHFVRMASEQLITGIDLFRSVAEEISSELPEMANEVSVASERAILAMQDFQKFLKSVSQGAPGSFALGKAEFDYKLKNEFFLDYDSDSLLKIGENLFGQADSIYRAFEAQLAANPAPTDSVFVLNCITKDDLLNYYQWEVEQTKLYLEEHNIVSVPDDIATCYVMETPVFLRKMIGGIAYQPAGPFSSDQTGYFYVRPIPDSLDEGQRSARYRYINRRGFKGSVVHEGFPGHHLQFVKSSLIENNVRKWQENNCYIEGWALYCEQMMYESGFFGNDQSRYLAILGGIAFRAARIVVDVKLQTGKMTIDEAVNWMSKALDDDSNFVRIEVNRYAVSPTVPMSYLTGKTEILRLRDTMRTREGEKFSLKDFHDRYLAEGMIPPKLLWEVWGL
jgi:uncharacterized protein (DUF885 family)